VIGPSLLSRRMPVLAACWLAGFAPSHGLHRPKSPEESPLRTSAPGIEEPAPPPGAAGTREAAPPTAPAGMSDNSFFIEEAYNQQPGVVQHIQNATWRFDRDGGDRTRSLSYAFTQEWPLKGVTHQIAYTLPYEWLRGDQPRGSGIGDILLNYRYQLWQESDARPAFAPRFSLMLPSGDDEEGLGAGSVGSQVNFPLSKKLGDFLHLHMNAGATGTPGARRDLPGGGRACSTDLLGFHVGFSSILLLDPQFNVLPESLGSVEGSIDDAGDSEEITHTLFSPGVRYAIIQRNGAQWVLGAAMPSGPSTDEDDIGLLAYLSFEHDFYLPPRTATAAPTGWLGAMTRPGGQSQRGACE